MHHGKDRTRHGVEDEHHEKENVHHKGEGVLPNGSSSRGINRDLFTILEVHSRSDEKLDRLWTEAHAIPDWLNWAQIERGQRVFYRHGESMLTGLLFNSLLGGMVRSVSVMSAAASGG